ARRALPSFPTRRSSDLARPRFPEFVFSAATNDFAAEVNERLEHLLQIQYARLAVEDGQINYAKARLHRRQLEELVEDNLRHRVRSEEHTSELQSPCNLV